MAEQPKATTAGGELTGDRKRPGPSPSGPGPVPAARAATPHEASAVARQSDSIAVGKSPDAPRLKRQRTSAPADEDLGDTSAQVSHGDTSSLQRSKSKSGCKRKQRWTNAEGQSLRRAIQLYGDNDWNAVAAEVKSRTARQCKDHYNEVIGPHINHGEWTMEEELKLSTLHAHLGPSWTLICQQMPGRPANACKNKFNGTLRHRHSENAVLSVYIRYLHDGETLRLDPVTRMRALMLATDFMHRHCGTPLPLRAEQPLYPQQMPGTPFVPPSDASTAFTSTFMRSRGGYSAATLARAPSVSAPKCTASPPPSAAAPLLPMGLVHSAKDLAALQAGWQHDAAQRTGSQESQRTVFPVGGTAPWDTSAALGPQPAAAVGPAARGNSGNGHIHGSGPYGHGHSLSWPEGAPDWATAATTRDMRFPMPLPLSSLLQLNGGGGDPRGPAPSLNFPGLPETRRHHDDAACYPGPNLFGPALHVPHVGRSFPNSLLHDMCAAAPQGPYGGAAAPMQGNPWAPSALGNAPLVNPFMGPTGVAGMPQGADMRGRTMAGPGEAANGGAATHLAVGPGSQMPDAAQNAQPAWGNLSAQCPDPRWVQTISQLRAAHNAGGAPPPM